MPRTFISSLAILIAATVGAGIFSLPFVFQKAGFFTSTILLAVLGFVIAATYSLYWDALQKEEANANIFSLLRKYFGKTGSVFGFVVMICELVLAMGVLLAVGTRFTTLAIPFARPEAAFFLFWLAGCLLLLKKTKESLRLEVFAVACIVFIILFITAIGLVRPAASGVDWSAMNPLLAFGPILFALSGWTGIEPVRDAMKKYSFAKNAWKLFSLAVGIVCAMYFLFAFSILRISNPVTPDTLSGVVSMGPWIVGLLSLLGAIAILAGYFPLGLETRRLLASAFHIPRRNTNLFIVVVPPLLVLATQGDFIKIMSITGGIFVSLQYILILAASHASRRFYGMKFFLWSIATSVFVLAMLGEAYYLLGG